MRHHIARMLIPVVLGLAMPPIAAHAQSDAQTFTAIATLSYTANDLHLPISSRQDVGAFSATSVIKYGDPTHWRVDTTTDQPALLQGTGTTVANGTTLTDSHTLLGQVFTDPIATGSATASIGDLLMLGFYRPQATSATDYVKAHQGHGSHAQIVDQATLLGQPVTVIKIWPVMSGSSSSCTSSSGNTPPKCTTHKHTYGQLMLWIDSRHLVPLRVQELDMPETFQQDLTFQVTDITYGQGPSAQDLSFSPTPSPAPSMPVRCDPSPCQGILPNTAWSVPIGFISARSPSGWHVSGEEETGAPGSSESVQGVAGLFLPNSAPRSGNLQADISGSYLLIQEQWRANGSPPFFQTGTEHAAGTCQVWTGIYPDGTRWLGYTHGSISLLASTNAFSQARLVHYAATHMCASG